MTELKSMGRSYAWSHGYTYSKIDKFLVNAKLMLKMAQMDIDIMNQGTSDLSPLSLEIDRIIRGTYRIFMFFNCIAKHPEFKGVKNRVKDTTGK